ncbi:hypothetical protein [Micromonospora sp. S-DT3-3-22]|uniref:hypothetical protein n=1 Tax=Micromonospora sp. S-DT3-3-22 TaxID=2755359 RepID=UPI00188EE716|nr:hypothetical protein [Micromonospora sp. S-DT3-3-22]
MTATAGGPLVRDMTPRQAVDLRVHHWLMIVGALLTAVALLLLSLLPDPPAEAVAMSAWVEHGHSLLLWSNELLFFAVICWGAGARGLFSAGRAGPSARIDVGGTALTVALVALVVVLLAVGRLSRLRHRRREFRRRDGKDEYHWRRTPLTVSVISLVSAGSSSVASAAQIVRTARAARTRRPVRTHAALTAGRRSSGALQQHPDVEPAVVRCDQGLSVGE